ncbi:hypothetical protein GUJ93_ZPchr0004g38848 [Zizania palustris]|uniref:Uncharacterized protein n=1 Tax=Zizania palustris TaxID=103762 RepID=A0A8J5W051_ZIZPA|nr:hypothetical protein GUJ93_ZPchr0004g38848 [Zizania palustris]
MMAAMAMASVQLTTATPPMRSRRVISISACAAPPRQRPPPSRSQHRRSPRRLRHDEDGDPPPRKRGPPPRPTRTRGPPLPRHQQSYTDEDGDQDDEGSFSGGTRVAAMPKPPAGFVLDDQGRCIAAASKRIVTIVSILSPPLSSIIHPWQAKQSKLTFFLQIDDTNKHPLECIIRRVFRSSQDHECMLLCPVDMYQLQLTHHASSPQSPCQTKPPISSSLSGLCRSSRAQISAAGSLYVYNPPTASPFPTISFQMGLTAFLL